MAENRRKVHNRIRQLRVADNLLAVINGLRVLKPRGAAVVVAGEKRNGLIHFLAKAQHRHLPRSGGAAAKDGFKCLDRLVLNAALLTKRSVTLATLLHLPPSLRGAVLWRRSNLDPAVDKARIASSPRNGSSQ